MNIHIKLLKVKYPFSFLAYTILVNLLAGWQSGHAAACKAVYAGSIPASASNL
jgi:hypothetical protein